MNHLKLHRLEVAPAQGKCRASVLRGALTSMGFLVACLLVLGLSNCSFGDEKTRDPVEQKMYYDHWVHPEGSPGVGNNPFTKRFWVGD